MEAQLAQRPRSLAMRSQRGSRPLFTRGPSTASSAGSAVSEVNRQHRTIRPDATAISMKMWPRMRTIDPSATPTISPAVSTVRPEVRSAIDTEVSTAALSSPSRASSSRNRLITNSA